MFGGLKGWKPTMRVPVQCLGHTSFGGSLHSHCNGGDIKWIAVMIAMGIPATTQDGSLRFQTRSRRWHVVCTFRLCGGLLLGAYYTKIMSKVLLHICRDYQQSRSRAKSLRQCKLASLRILRTREVCLWGVSRSDPRILRRYAFVSTLA